MPWPKKKHLARLYLILAFPLWLPRLVFCLLIDFWRFQPKDASSWGSRLSDSGRGPRLKGPPALLVYKGGRSNRPVGPYAKSSHPLGLRLIEGGETVTATSANRQAKA